MSGGRGQFQVKAKIGSGIKWAGFLNIADEGHLVLFEQCCMLY